ncbi:MAG: hypothetical protein ACM3XO_06280 [Bacteroidota bacterium]
MREEYNLDNLENFKINPHVWLRTLLAIAGDKDRKAEAVQIISEQTGFPPEKVEVILATTISVLMNDTRAN